MTNSEARFASALAAWQRTRQAHAGAVTEAETRSEDLEASATANPTGDLPSQDQVACCVASACMGVARICNRGGVPALGSSLTLH